MTAVLYVVVSLLCLHQCTAHYCTGGAKTSEVRNNKCSQYCEETQQCLCSAETAGPNSTFVDCKQRCENDSGVAISKCNDMVCKNASECGQGCKSGGCRMMECKASVQECEQDCDDAILPCSKMVCSAEDCEQACFNCTMECTKGVKRCEQTCRGGVCYSKCDAAHCTVQCDLKIPLFESYGCQILNVTEVTMPTTVVAPTSESANQTTPNPSSGTSHVTSLVFHYLGLACIASLIV